MVQFLKMLLSDILPPEVALVMSACDTHFIITLITSSALCLEASSRHRLRRFPVNMFFILMLSHTAITGLSQSKLHCLESKWCF